MAPSPIIDDDRIAAIIKFLERAHTVAELQDRFEMSRTSVYRDLDRITERGYIVAHSGRSRPVRYRVVNRLPGPEKP